MWEDDKSFMQVIEAYTELNPSRVDCRKAWSVWTEKGLGQHVDKILAALPTYAVSEQWRKNDGQYIPNLSKWLADGGWRMAGKVVPTPEELAERERITKAGIDAYARIERERRFGREPSPDDLAAVARWQELNQRAAA